MYQAIVFLPLLGAILAERPVMATMAPMVTVTPPLPLAMTTGKPQSPPPRARAPPS